MSNEAQMHPEDYHNYQKQKYHKHDKYDNGGIHRPPGYFTADGSYITNPNMHAAVPNPNIHSPQGPNHVYGFDHHVHHGPSHGHSTYPNSGPVNHGYGNYGSQGHNGIGSTGYGQQPHYGSSGPHYGQQHRH